MLGIATSINEKLYYGPVARFAIVGVFMWGIGFIMLAVNQRRETRALRASPPLTKLPQDDASE